MVLLIPTLKRDLDSRHFAMEEELQSVIAEFFASDGRLID